MFDWVMYFVFGLSLVIILFSIEPSTFRKFWDGISRRQKVKTESIQTIIDNGFWKEDLGKNILADTIVFGHTHVADDSKAKYLQKPHERRFINSGSWGDLGKENTFVYIDAEGPVLFSWPELPEGALPEWKEDMLPEQISSPTGDAKGIGIPISSITRWMRKNFWGRG
jgi:UDP-2,3-diacylglucosamine pyrophosphatase LpxH